MGVPHVLGCCVKFFLLVACPCLQGQATSKKNLTQHPKTCGTTITDKINKDKDKQQSRRT
jgi:hypothetical protein